MLGTPPVFWLVRKRIPSVVAVLLVVAGMIAILLISSVIVGASINNFYTELPAYQTRLQEQASAFQYFLDCFFGNRSVYRKNSRAMSESALTTGLANRPVRE